LLGYEKGRRVLIAPTPSTPHAGQPLWLPGGEGGVGLIETLVALAIMAILMAIAAPNFAAWIRNTQIRTAAEAIQAGLQQARAEAVQRNAEVRFSLMSSVDNNCDLSTTDSNWVISLDDPSGACASAAASGASDPAPRIIAVRDKNNGSPSTAVLSDQSNIIFTSLGRVKSASAATICVGSNNVTLSCTAAAPERQLKVLVSAGGQIRMCNPALASSDPQGC